MTKANAGHETEMTQDFHDTPGLNVDRTRMSPADNTNIQRKLIVIAIVAIWMCISFLLFLGIAASQ